MAKSKEELLSSTAAPTIPPALAQLAGNPLRFIRKRKLAALFDASPDTLMGWAADGYLPKPYALSPHVVAWNVDEIVSWLASRPRVNLIPTAEKKAAREARRNRRKKKSGE